MKRLAAILVVCLLPFANANATSDSSCFYDEAFYDTSFYDSSFYDEASCVTGSSFDLTGMPLRS